MVKHKYKGEEMRDYQQKKIKTPMSWPEAVNRQALWAAKDMARRQAEDGRSEREDRRNIPAEGRRGAGDGGAA